MKTLKLKIIKYCLFVLPFLIVSCEKDFVDTINSPQQDSSSQQINSSQTVNSPQEGQNKMLDVATGEAEVNAVKLKKNVKVLDEIANGQMISYSDAKIEFVSHESVNNIQVGDVLNSAPSTLAEYGILARVLSKEVKDGKIILQVEPGEIDDLFDEADFSFSTERGVTLNKGAKKDFSFDLNFGIETSNDKYECSVQVAGKLDFTFDFKLNKVFDKSDNELNTKFNLHFDRNTSNPDLIFALSKTFEETLIDDFKLGVISVPIGGAVIPFTISTSVGAEYKINFGTLFEPVGFDVFGDIGFERATRGGNEIHSASRNWNTLDYKFVLDLDNGSGNFSSEFKPFKVKLNVTPFKKVGDFFDVTPLSVFGEAYVGGNLGYSLATSCITFKNIYLGIEGGVEGNFKDLNYEVTVAPNDVKLEGVVANLWCFDSNTGTATYTSNLSPFDISEHVAQEAQPSFTIENSSGLHMAEGLNGKKVVFKSMKGRNSNTEDHNLLYSTSPSDDAGRYLTMESAPGGEYYNPNYKVLGTSPYATEDAVFKLHATDHGRYLIEGANGKFADLLVGVNNPNSHQKFIEFYRTYNEAKNQDDCKFQILMHPHRPGHYFIYKKDKGYLTPKGNNPARLKLVTRSQEQEFIMMEAENVQISPDIDVFDLSNTENQSVFMQAYGFGGDQSNNYLKYDSRYKLVTGNSTSADYFTIYKNNDGTQSIKGTNGKYLDIYSSGGFIALFNSTDRYCGDCKFRIEKVSGTTDWYNIRHPKTNKVLSYRNGGGLQFISGSAGWNERFRIIM